MPATYPHLMPPEYQSAGRAAGLTVATGGVIANGKGTNGSPERRVAAASIAAGAAVVTVPWRRRWLGSREARSFLWGVTAAGVIAAVGFWVGRNSLSVDDGPDQPIVVEQSDPENESKKNDLAANHSSLAGVNHGGDDHPLPKSADRRDRTDLASARGKPDDPDFGGGDPRGSSAPATITPRPATPQKTCTKSFTIGRSIKSAAT